MDFIVVSVSSQYLLSEEGKNHIYIDLPVECSSKRLLCSDEIVVHDFSKDKLESKVQGEEQYQKDKEEIFRPISVAGLHKSVFLSNSISPTSILVFILLIFFLLPSSFISLCFLFFIFLLFFFNFFFHLPMIIFTFLHLSSGLCLRISSCSTCPFKLLRAYLMNGLYVLITPSPCFPRSFSLL